VSRKNDCGWQVEALDVNLCMSVQRARGLVEALNSFQRSRPSKFTKFNRLESNLDLDSHSCKFFREMLHARTQTSLHKTVIDISKHRDKNAIEGHHESNARLHGTTFRNLLLKVFSALQA
jgi:hypothetical protein